MSPSAGKVKTVPAGPAEYSGRLSKARQFLNVAHDVEDLNSPDHLHDVADACVTLYVHCGIAAADAMCARARGEHAKGDDHNQAVILLASVDKQASRRLSTLLGMKTRAGYGHDPVSREQLTKARRAAEALVDAATT